MVFRSLTLFARNKGPDEFWRKRRILRMTAHYKNRKQNCYGLAIRGACRAMQYATLGRILKKADLKKLWQTRLEGVCQEHGISEKILMDGLAKCNIFLNRKSLSDLAIWEPRSFRSLVDLATARAKADGLNSIRNLDPPAHVITRGMLR